MAADVRNHIKSMVGVTCDVVAQGAGRGAALAGQGGARQGSAASEQAMIDRRATHPGRRAQPRHRHRAARPPFTAAACCTARSRSSWWTSADGSCCSSAVRKISLGRAVGEFLLRPSAPGRTDAGRGAPPARRRAGRDGRAVVRLFRPLPGRARQRHARKRVRLRLFRTARRPSRSPTRPRSPTSRTGRSTTSAGASSATRMRLRSGSSTIFETMAPRFRGWRKRQPIPAV